MTSVGAPPDDTLSAEPEAVRQDRVALSADSRQAPDLVRAILELTAEIRALRTVSGASNRDGGDGGGPAAGRAELQQIVHGLVENLDELEADNAALRAENERLVASHQAGLPSWNAPAPAARPSADSQLSARADYSHLELAEENARLRESLARARADEQETRSMLRLIDSSRAWKIVSFYWSLARRLGRDRSQTFRPPQS